jgi:hypothetical protein
MEERTYSRREVHRQNHSVKNLWTSLHQYKVLTQDKVQVVEATNQNEEVKRKNPKARGTGRHASASALTSLRQYGFPKVGILATKTLRVHH